MDDQDLEYDDEDKEYGSKPAFETKTTNREQRRATLGFHPQQELVYNSLLPIPGMDEESAEMFKSIKANLGKSVRLADFKLGFQTWTARLYQ